jgi:hypothetical protein
MDTIEPTPATEGNPLDPKGAAGAKKCPLHLIPPVAMREIAWAHKHGAEKYGEWNWRGSKVCVTTYVAAMMRHLNAYRDGEDIDPESGLSHLTHIGASLNILLDAEACETLVDDRSVRQVKFPPKGIPDFVKCTECGSEQTYFDGWHCPNEKCYKNLSLDKK